MAAEQLGQALYDPDSGVLSRDGVVLRLTDLEARALAHLWAARGRIVPREELLSDVWGRDPQNKTRSVDVLVQRLRQKIEADPAKPDALRSSYGRGYRLATRSSPSRPALGQDRPLRAPLFGREADLERLRLALAQPGLVTLLGPPGVGKTRLAQASMGPHDVLASLSQANDASGVVQAVGAALRIPSLGADAVEQVGRALRARGSILVVLDEFEAVVRSAAATVGRWRTVAPHAVFLATSRSRLDLPDERVLDLGPLAAEDAERMFIERAHSADVSFEPDEGMRNAIRTLVVALDGLPLAVALAAARVRVLPPELMVRQLGDRFRLLSSSRGHDGRHLSLRAALAASWELLADSQRSALAQLSVFEGGFTLESAEAVLDLAAATDPWAVDVIEGLVDCSLVVRLGDGRFDFLESVRAYGAERLGSEGGFTGGGPSTRREAEERHGRFFLAYGTDEGMEALHRHGSVERRMLLRLEVGNVVAACRRALGRADAEVALATCRAALAPLVDCGRAALAVELAESVRRLSGLNGEALLRVHEVVGSAHRYAGTLDRDATDHRAMLAVARSLGDRHSEGAALRQLGYDLVWLSLAEEATVCFEAAVVVFVGLGDALGVARATLALGQVHVRHGRLEEALVAFESSLPALQAHGDRGVEVDAWIGMGDVHIDLGNFAEAEACYSRCIATTGGVWYQRGEAKGHLGVGNARAGLGRSAEAVAAFEECVRVCRATGFPVTEACAMGNIGALLAADGRLDGALDHLESSLRMVAEVDARVEGFLLGLLALVEGRRGDLQAARVHLARGEPLLRLAGDRVELGKFLCAKAEVDHRAGARHAARLALDEAGVLAAAVGVRRSSELAQLLRRTEVLLAEPP